PLVSVQGHNARPYAVETAAAVLASYLLIRAAQDPRPACFGGYGGSLVLLGSLHLFGLLLIAAHALALIPAARARSSEPGAGRPGGQPVSAGTPGSAGMPGPPGHG